MITTNLILSAAEIVVRLQKRWVEDNGFECMGEHFNIDLLTNYKTEPAPDKIMERSNPECKEINAQIVSKKSEFRALKEECVGCLPGVKDKDSLLASKTAFYKGGLLSY